MSADNKPEIATSKSDNRWITGAGLPDIVTAGDPRLRQIAQEYKEVADLQPLCEKLPFVCMSRRRFLGRCSY